MEVRGDNLLFRFMRHVLYAGFLFILIAVVAASIWYLTNFLERIGADELAFLCHWVANILFGIDIFCLATFVLAEGWKLVRDIIRDARQDEMSSRRSRWLSTATPLINRDHRARKMTNTVGAFYRVTISWLPPAIISALCRGCLSVPRQRQKLLGCQK